MFAASNIVAFTHPYANTFSNPLIRSNEGLALKTSAFQYFYDSKIDLRPIAISKGSLIFISILLKITLKQSLIQRPFVTFE